MSITVPFDPTLYPSHCVSEAAEAFAQLCAVKVRTSATGSVAEFYIADGDEQIVDEFLNYVLTRSIEDYLTRSHSDLKNQ